MFILRPQSSSGAPYLVEGHVGPFDAGSGVTHDEHQALRDALQAFLGTLPSYYDAVLTHPLGQPADDVGEESRATALRDARQAFRDKWQAFCDARNAYPVGQLANDVGEESRETDWSTRLLPGYYYGVPVNYYEMSGVDASWSTLVHWNAGGGTSVHVASRPDPYVFVPRGRGGEVYGAGRFVTQVTAGGASGGGPILPLLLFSDPMGASGGAPHSSQDGVAGYWPLAVTDAFLTGDEETPYSGSRALAVTGVFPRGDGGTPYLGSAALNPAVRYGGELIAPAVRYGELIARDEHVIDIPLPPLAADRAEEENTDTTTGTTDQAHKYLEKLLYTSLPGCVLALVPLSGASDNVKLATYIILAMLIALLVIGMSFKASVKHTIRLSTCAGIFAMTVLVSLQFSRGIHIAIAALVGAALSGITLAV